MPGYQQAAAEIEARGGAVYAMSGEPGERKSLLAMLFGGGEDDEEENGQSPRRGGTTGVGGRGAASAQIFFTAQNQTAGPQPELIASARRDSPRVDTFLRSPDTTPTAAIVASSQSQKLEALAAAEQPDVGGLKHPRCRAVAAAPAHRTGAS